MADVGGRGVLVTRPAADAAETAARLRSMGWQPVLSPMLRVEPRPLLPLAGRRPQAVLVTSGNALAGLPPALHATRLLAVGDATAARARAYGFVDVESAGGDAPALVGHVAACCAPCGPPLLLATGQGLGFDVVAALHAEGFRVLRRVVYATWPVLALAEPARRALGDGSATAALFYSAATAAAFTEAVRRAGLASLLAPVTAVAISAAAAACLGRLPWRDIRVASRPNQDGLLACL